MSPEAWAIWATCSTIFAGATLGVTALKHRSNTGRWPIPRRAPRLVALVEGPLRDDIEAVRQYGLVDWLRVAVETGLALGLALRGMLHVGVAVAAAPSVSHQADFSLRLDPITSDRPLWNEASARVVTALLATWGVRATPSDPAPWVPAGVGEIALIWGVANAAVLIADPVVGVAAELSERRGHSQTHG